MGKRIESVFESTNDYPYFCLTFALLRNTMLAIIDKNENECCAKMKTIANVTILISLEIGFNDRIPNRNDRGSKN